MNARPLARQKQLENPKVRFKVREGEERGQRGRAKVLVAN